MTDHIAADELLITLTADIVAAHLGNNNVAVGDVASLIASVHSALSDIGKLPGRAEDKPMRAVSIRASIKPDHLVSMIDGKPYKLLRRHLLQNGYTPESYRETFGLPRDYPMVAASYAEQRRDLAKKIGLGRKSGDMAKSPKAATSKGRAKKAASDTAKAQ